VYFSTATPPWDSARRFTPPRVEETISIAVSERQGGVAGVGVSNFWRGGSVDPHREIFHDVSSPDGGAVARASRAKRPYLSRINLVNFGGCAARAHFCGTGRFCLDGIAKSMLKNVPLNEDSFSRAENPAERG
jgi:hypothetical protein